MGVFSRLDFTIPRYRALCETAATSKYRVVTMREYFETLADPRPRLIMRHDIDRSPGRALEMALVENKHNIRATYYFRARRETFVPKIIDRIAEMGHEIGYHYETVDKANGRLDMACALFAKELRDFRSRYDVKTVCAHGNPLTTHDNKRIWDTIGLSDFGLLGEPYLSIDYAKVAYFSDSGRTWLKSEAQKMPGKDDIVTPFDGIRARCTDDLMSIITEGTLPNICVLSHSERWSKNAAEFASRYMLDLAFSSGKWAIYRYRRMRNGK